jgi:hypothetical protein
MKARAETGRAVTQAVRHRPFTEEARISPSPVHAIFVVDRVALGQVFLRVIRFLLLLSFHQSSIIIHSGD